MKKSLIALAVLAASGAAMAQSSVTLYGVADVFVSSKKVTTLAFNANRTDVVVSTQRQTGVDSGGLNGSRWGLKGSEDLGGGLNAIFTLESGFNIDTGAGSTDGMFNRQAFVGLASSGFGTVALGRQYSAYEGVRGSFLSAQGNSPSFDATNGPVPINETVNNYLVNGTLPAIAAAQDALLAVVNTQVGRIGAWTGYAPRINNSISYTTPNFSGFKGSVVYGFGENKSASASATKNVSASLSYENGPIGVAVGHQNDEIVQGFHLKNTAIGGYYDFGMVKPFLSYNQAKYDGVAKQNEWAVGVRAPLGATTLVAQYAQSKGDDLGKNQSLGLSAEYSLSKRTTAYAAFNQTKVEIADNNKNTVFGLGVRHSF